MAALDTASYPELSPLVKAESLACCLLNKALSNVSTACPANPATPVALSAPDSPFQF